MRTSIQIIFLVLAIFLKNAKAKVGSDEWLGNLSEGYTSEEDYEKAREEVLKQETEWRFGSDQKLNDIEERLNAFYVKEKYNLLNASFRNEALYRPSLYFLSNDYTDRPKNKVYEILRLLPKGALLHSHSTATQDLAKIGELLFSLDNCKLCEHPTELKYFLHYYDDGVKDGFIPKVDPKNKSSMYKCEKCPEPGDCYYYPKLKNLRAQLSMHDGFDYSGKDIQTIWKRFATKNTPQGGAVSTWHVYQELFKATLTMLVEDNVQYAELREPFGNKYDKNGTKIPTDQVMKFLETQIKLYKEKHSNFYGVNFIYAMGRGRRPDENDTSIKTLRNERSFIKSLRKKLKTANELYKKYSIVRGFDLVGYEEFGRTLKNLSAVFLEFRKTNSDNSMPFVFHAGETLWTGFDVDRNVLDAVLLGTKRIGHGYALDAHPYVLELVRQQEIGIELNPISNQVLALVDDIRNHRNKRLLDSAHKPGVLSNKTLRFSVNSDDCRIFGTKPITDDMYMLVMAMTPKHSDLRVVKKMAYDSIHTSLLNSEEKKDAISKFEEEWNKVVEKLLAYGMINIENTGCSFYRILWNICGGIQ